MNEPVRPFLFQNVGSEDGEDAADGEDHTYLREGNISNRKYLFTLDRAVRTPRHDPEEISCNLEVATNFKNLFRCQMTLERWFLS